MARLVSMRMCHAMCHVHAMQPARTRVHRALPPDRTSTQNVPALTNLRLGYGFDRRTSLALDVFNLFDRKVNDIEYFYESRLPLPAPGEVVPVADKHVHPAEPRTLRLTLRMGF